MQQSIQEKQKDVRIRNQDRRHERSASATRGVEKTEIQQDLSSEDEGDWTPWVTEEEEGTEGETTETSESSQDQGC